MDISVGSFVKPWPTEVRRRYRTPSGARGPTIQRSVTYFNRRAAGCAARAPWAKRVTSEMERQDNNVPLPEVQHALTELRLAARLCRRGAVAATDRSSSSPERPCDRPDRPGDVGRRR